MNRSPLGHRERRGTGALFLAFAGLGGTAAVVPAVLPSLAELHPGEAHRYLAAVPVTFLGLLLGVLGSGRVSAVVSSRTTVCLGSLLQAAALTTVILASGAAGFVTAAGVAGLGFGLVEAAGSVLARQVAGPRLVDLLAALTATVALLAAGCPLIVALLPWAQAPMLALGFVAALQLGAAVATAGPAFREPRALTTPDRSWFPRLGLVAGALAMYVGVEAVLSGWSAVLAADRLAVGARSAAFGTTAFWTLMATGRVVAWLVLRSRTPRPRHLVLAATTAAGGLGVAASGAWGTTGLIVALGLTVVFLGPCYALILGLGLAQVDLASARRVTGPLVACGAAGGALVPALALTGGGAAPGAGTFGLGAVLLLLVAVLTLLAAPLARSHPGPAPSPHRSTTQPAEEST